MTETELALSPPIIIHKYAPNAQSKKKILNMCGNNRFPATVEALTTSLYITALKRFTSISCNNFSGSILNRRQLTCY